MQLFIDLIVNYKRVIVFSLTKTIDMFTKHIESLIARLEEIEIEFMGADFDFDYCEKLKLEMYEIERKLNQFPYVENQSLLRKAERLITKIKKDNDFDED